MTRHLLPLLAFAGLCAAMVGIAPSQEPERRDYDKLKPRLEREYIDALRMARSLRWVEETTDPRARQDPEQERDINDVFTRLRHLEDKIAKLHQAERYAEAEEVEREAQPLREALEHYEQQLRQRGPDVEMLHEYLQELHEEMERLERSGDLAQAEELAREAQEVQRALESRQERGEGHDEEIAEWEERIHHLFAASENLHAAGLHEEAEQCARRAEQMAQELEGMMGGGGPDGELMAHVEHLTGMVEELREEVSEMRGMIEELRAQVRQLKSGR